MWSMEYTRRDIAALTAGGLFTGLVAGAQPVFAAGPGPVSIEDTPWYGKIKQVGQTNFNERDPEQGDVEAWADYWASAKVEAVALSVSGPVAFYPTKVPFFHVSAYLNGRDLFGECLTAAKKRGIRVFGRISPDIQFMDPKLLAAHPDWFRRDQKGELQSPAPDIAFTCQFTGQFTEQQPAILRELNERYDIDGIYMNGWPTMQVCYCEACRKIGDPQSDVYKAAVMEGAVNLTDLYRRIVLQKSKNNFYSCNVAGGLEESGLDQWQLTRDAVWYTSDNQARSAMDDPIWQDAQQVKFAHAMMGKRPVAAVTAGYTRSGATMWRQISDSTAEPTCRMAQTAAAGGIVWYHQLGLEQGFKRDRRWQKHGREFLAWHAANQDHFRNIRSLANVAIVVPSRTLSRYRPGSNENRADYLQGLYAALIEARIPVDLVHEKDLSLERLAAYDLLMLPNFALMSDVQAAALQAFARSGGSLLATFETGLYDENGKPRPDFALAELFGIAKGGEARTDKSSVLGLSRVSAQVLRKWDAVGAGFEDTDWIAGPTWMQPVRTVADAPMTFIDPYPVYPPEAVYPRSPPGDNPSLVLAERNRGRFAYFAGDMDATYWQLDNPDLGRQLVNTIRWLLHDRAPVMAAGPGLIEVIPWETELGYAIHLLNYNGPHALRGHMRTLLDIGPQQVRMTLPAEKQIRRVRLLWSDQEVEFHRDGRTIQFTVPKVGFYEVVALET